MVYVSAALRIDVNNFLVEPPFGSSNFSDAPQQFINAIAKTEYMACGKVGPILKCLCYFFPELFYDFSSPLLWPLSDNFLIVLLPDV